MFKCVRDLFHNSHSVYSWEIPIVGFANCIARTHEKIVPVLSHFVCGYLYCSQFPPTVTFFDPVNPHVPSHIRARQPVLKRVSPLYTIYLLAFYLFFFSLAFSFFISSRLYNAGWWIQVPLVSETSYASPIISSLYFLLSFTQTHLTSRYFIFLVSIYLYFLFALFVILFCVTMDTMHRKIIRRWAVK